MIEASKAWTHQYCWFVPVVLAVFAAATSAGRADENAAPLANRLDATELKAQLQSLERELAEEKATLETRQQTQASELTELQASRGDLAHRLLTAQAQRESVAARLKELQAKSESASMASEALVAEANSIPSLLIEATEQLQLLLQEVPGTDESVLRTRDLLATFSEEKEGTSSREAMLPAISELFDLIDRTHEQAGRVTSRKTRIFTAADKQEDVSLLSVGLSRFAYITQQGERAGLALSSPSEASGYRWSEDLPPNLQRSIHAVWAALESGRESTIGFPLDPIGRVEPRSLNKQESLYDTFWLGGPVMFPISFVAILGFLLVIERLITLYVRNGGAGRLADKVLAASAAGRVDEARRLCAMGRGTVSRVMAACLARHEAGQRAMEDSIQEQLLHEIPRLQRSLGGIAVLAGVAPMLGLLGTVTGIISTFEAIRAFGAVNPESMAAGISEALIATAAGLMIAIPVVIIHSLLRGRSDRITADAERYAAALLTTLVYGAPAAAPGANNRPAIASESPAEEAASV